jgi:2-dehydro-3-deoxy-D-arabinonate dehydratase
MKLVQFFLPGKGKRVGVVQGDRLLDITSGEEGVACTLDLLVQGKTAQGVTTRATWLTRRIHRKALDWKELRRAPSRRAPHLLVPIDAPEVWGVEDSIVGERRETSGRPAFFFKATAHRVVGPHVPILLRSDAKLTMPEAALGVVLGPAGSAVAFTACHDVTARDLQRAGFLSQAKVYLGACALGPCLITSDDIEDPSALQARCSVLRGGGTVFSEAATIGRGQQEIARLAGWLCRDDVVPVGAVLAVGTGIAVPDSMALSDGDQVDIEVQGIGWLSNPVRQL